MQRMTLFVGLALVFTVGCGYQSNDDWMVERQSVRQDLEETIGAVDGRIETLEAELADADREGQERLESRIEDLRERGRDLEDAIDELAGQTEETWDEWSRDVQDILDGQQS